MTFNKLGFKSTVLQSTRKGPGTPGSIAGGTGPEQYDSWAEKRKRDKGGAASYTRKNVKYSGYEAAYEKTLKLAGLADIVSKGRQRVSDFTNVGTNKNLIDERQGDLLNLDELVGRLANRMDNNLIDQAPHTFRPYAVDQVPSGQPRSPMYALKENIEHFSDRGIRRELGALGPDARELEYALFDDIPRTTRELEALREAVQWGEKTRRQAATGGAIAGGVGAAGLGAYGITNTLGDTE